MMHRMGVRVVLLAFATWCAVGAREAYLASDVAVVLWAAGAAIGLGAFVRGLFHPEEIDCNRELLEAVSREPSRLEQLLDDRFGRRRPPW